MHAFITQNPKPKTQNPIDTLVIEPENSIGIEEVRQIQHFLSRKPMQSEQNTIVIHQAHLLTVPAQNALLKTLEEPPGNSQIFLVTDFPDQLLPTVLSRVQLAANPKPQIPNHKELAKSQKLLDGLLATRVGERLKLIEDQAFTRDTALEFLDHLEHLITTHLEGGGSLHLPGEIALYNLIVQTRKYLKANCNLKLTMDNLVINL